MRGCKKTGERRTLFLSKPTTKRRQASVVNEPSFSSLTYVLWLYEKGRKRIDIWTIVGKNECKMMVGSW